MDYTVIAILQLILSGRAPDSCKMGLELFVQLINVIVI
jgi:hypothetical protein